MSITVDPTVAARYDQMVAEYTAASTELSAELTARQEELDKQLAADRDKLAELGQDLASAHEQPGPRVPDRRAEDNDVSARAEDYQELDEDPTPEPPPAPPPPVRQSRADDDEVTPFRWDDDPTPPPAPARQPARAPRDEEDLSDHDWLE